MFKRKFDKSNQIDWSQRSTHSVKVIGTIKNQK